MSNSAMSNETDLDWLARNVHVWDESAYAAMCGGVERVLWISGAAYGQKAEFKNAVTKDQWLARRAELQHKPSWADAPEWAEWLAQDASGSWYFYPDGARLNSIDEKEMWSHYAEEYAAKYAGGGEVLGDWRDTLERRPADLSEPAVTARLQEATDNVLAAVPELKSDRFKFEPLTSIEDNQEQDMKQDNSWFERGELPPVGTACEYTLGVNAPWYQCEIKYVIRGNGVVMKRIPCGGEQYCGLLHRNPVSFRPIRTERDVLIEIIKETDDTDDKIADAILAAGFSLGDK